MICFDDVFVCWEYCDDDFCVGDGVCFVGCDWDVGCLCCVDCCGDEVEFVYFVFCGDEVFCYW